MERLPGTRTATDEGRGGGGAGGTGPAGNRFLPGVDHRDEEGHLAGAEGDRSPATAVVIVVVLIIVAFLGLVDFGPGPIAQSILHF